MVCEMCGSDNIRYECQECFTKFCECCADENEVLCPECSGDLLEI